MHACAHVCVPGLLYSFIWSWELGLFSYLDYCESCFSKIICIHVFQNNVFGSFVDSMKWNHWEFHGSSIFSLWKMPIFFRDWKSRFPLFTFSLIATPALMLLLFFIFVSLKHSAVLRFNAGSVLRPYSWWCSGDQIYMLVPRIKLGQTICKTNALLLIYLPSPCYFFNYVYLLSLVWNDISLFSNLRLPDNKWQIFSIYMYSLRKCLFVYPTFDRVANFAC